MDHPEQRHLRRKSLNQASLLWIAVVVASCIAAPCTCAAQTAPSPAIQVPPSRATIRKEHALALQGLRTGRAVLRQEEHLTVLYFTPTGQAAATIPLTYPSKYPHSTAGPFGARLVAESPHGFLIFTDSFASNPGNIQGQCGASETGERFLHVVSFAQPPHETFAAIIESCLLDITPSPRNPAYNAAAHTLTFRLHQEDHDTSTTLHIEKDGAVSPSAK